MTLAYEFDNKRMIVDFEIPICDRESNVASASQGFDETKSMCEEIINEIDNIMGVKKEVE